MGEVLPVTYLAQHGETAWSLTGQHTGLTVADERNIHSSESWMTLIHPDDFAGYVETWNRCSAAGQPGEIEAGVGAPTGSTAGSCIMPAESGLSESFAQKLGELYGTESENPLHPFGSVQSVVRSLGFGAKSHSDSLWHESRSGDRMTETMRL